MATVSDAERQAILEEYKALRAEILALIQARNQFMISDIIAFGALFAAAVQFHNVFFLVAPLIHCPFMFYWTYTDRQIVKIGHYIKDMIEPRVNGLRWEHSMFASRLEVWGEASLPKTGRYIPLRRLIGFYPTELSALATFAGSTIISLVSYVSGISVRGNQAGVSNFTVTRIRGFRAIKGLCLKGFLR